MTATRVQQHFIQSRFNLHIALRQRVCPTEESYQTWCAERADLFLAVTLPSMLGQSTQAFEWLVYFDVERNQPVERVLDALSGHSNIHPVFYDGRNRQTWDLTGRARLGVAARTAADTEVVVSTKLDSDDGLHRDYVRVIGEHSRRLSMDQIGDGIALNCSFGALMVEGRFFALPYDRNPYLSVVEAVGTPLRTAMTIQHHKIDQRMDVIQVLDRAPLWLQVVHKRNAFNQARQGLLELAHREEVAAMFGITPSALERLEVTQTGG